MCAVSSCLNKRGQKQGKFFYTGSIIKRTVLVNKCLALVPVLFTPGVERLAAGPVLRGSRITGRAGGSFRVLVMVFIQLTFFPEVCMVTAVF